MVGAQRRQTDGWMKLGTEGEVGRRVWGHDQSAR